MMMFVDLLATILLAALVSLALQGEKSLVKSQADKIGVASLSTSVIVFILSLFVIEDGVLLFIHLAAVALLIGLGAIWSFDYVVNLLKIENPVYVEEARGIIEKLEEKQKTMAIAGAVITLFMLVSALSWG